MPDERRPKKVVYGELQEGKRSQGDQKKRYKDTLKSSLKDFDIPIGVLGTDCTGAIKVLRTHQQRNKQAKIRKRRNQKKIPTPKTEVGKNQTNNQVLIP